MIAVDTSVLVDFFANRPSAPVERLAAAFEDDEGVVITGIVRAECLAGVRDQDVAVLASRLDLVPTIQFESIDFDAAAALYRAARHAGQTVRNVVDCLIAAPCIRLDLPLLHADADFDKLVAISELRVIRP